MKLQHLSAIASILLSVTIPPTYADVDLNRGLVAYYPFDGNANDASGNGMDGSLSNASFTAGRFGSGLSLSGAADSYCEVADNGLLSPSQAVTISLWMNASSFTNSFSGLIYKSASTPTSAGFSDRSYTLWLRSDGGIHFTSTPAGSGSQVVDNSPANGTQLDQFFNVIGIVDTASHLMSIYINGDLADSTSYAGDDIKTGNFPLRIGAPFFTVGDQGAFNGVLDDVRIYNRALSQQEVSSLATSAPEPSSMLLLSTGAIAMMIARKRQPAMRGREPFPVS